MNRIKSIAIDGVGEISGCDRPIEVVEESTGVWFRQYVDKNTFVDYNSRYCVAVEYKINWDHI